MRARPEVLALSAVLTLLPGPIAAQAAARVRRPENFRDGPNGTVLGRLQPGTPLTVVSHKSSWLEVYVQGWIWTRSLQKVDRDGFNLIVSASKGENLRASPAGKVLGHFERGTLLHELGRRPGWLHVKRQGWIWAASVVQPRATGTPPPARSGSSHGTAPAEARTDTSARKRAASASKGAASASKGATSAGKGATSAGNSAAAATKPAGFVRAGNGGTAILTSAGGDTMAVTRPGVQLRVLSRNGNWAHVRLEGWAWLPAGTAASTSAAVDTALTPAVVKKAPRKYRGQVVAWTLQFISLEYAEKVRTDFFQGEPYLLTRFGGSSGSFVYVAVPPAWMDVVQGLEPLDRIFVTGRIRTGASSLTGTPIIDLLSLKRLRARD